MQLSTEQTSRFDELVTLVHGGLVCLSGPDGGIDPASFQGVYYRDLRLLSRLELTLCGQRPGLLATQRDGSSVAHHLYIAAQDAHATPTALLSRRREVGAALVDRYRVQAFGEPLTGELTLRLETDFLPALKDAGPRPAPRDYAVVDGGWEATKGRWGVRVEVDGPQPDRRDGLLWWTVDVNPGQVFEVSVTLWPCEDGEPVKPDAVATPPPPALAVRSGPAAWRRTVASAAADVAALRMRVPHLDLTYLAAGAPWFMALFGRDTLLTAWESLVMGTDVALDVLESLARYQGQRDDPRTGEQPGKILHELRTGGVELFGLRSGQPYYGTVDASPLFAMLLAESYRWGADLARVRALLPAARAALDWCAAGGDPDGDGYVEYAAVTPGSSSQGLTNQGWKDSGDPMVHADGTQARGPIALAEVQAYVWAAHQALARLEDDLGDAQRAAVVRARAAQLRTAFHRDYWLPDRGLIAMALDGDKRPLAVASSNMGHCLWAGILDDDVAAVVAERLDADDLRARWGIRTLASSEVVYNPLGYHLGSIWPHDAAIGAAGLMRYGHVDAALRVVDGLLAAAEHFQWRLPELFGGIDEGLSRPVPYPTACSPQAWSAAAPLLLLRTVLRLDPDVPAGRVALAPVLAEHEGLEVTGITIGSGALELRIRGGRTEVLRAPAGVRIDGQAPTERNADG